MANDRNERRKRSPKQHIKQLNRRMQYLADRIADPNRKLNGPGDYDKAEYYALRWAIDILEVE